MEQLLKKGADVEQQDRVGATLLHHMARNGQLRKFERFEPELQMIDPDTRDNK